MMLRLYGWKFVWVVALPLIAATLGVYLLANDLMSRVTTGANEADHLKTRQIVLSALEAAEQQLANVATDNSMWDDAARQVYAAELDEEWVRDTWGVTSEDGVNYDLVFVVDRTRPLPLSGYKSGKPFRTRLSSYFLQDFQAFLASLPANLSDHSSRGSLMMTTDGIALVAAAPVVPTSDDLEIAATDARFLVFIRFVTADFLAKIADQYVIQDLRLAPAGTSPATGVAIDSFDGKPVASFQWKDNRPGDAAMMSVSMTAAAALGFLAAVMISIGFLCWRLVRDIAGRERAANHAALHDRLTGLPNRAGLVQHLEARLGAGEPVAMAFADLDGFKEVNDTYDHETGDKLIRGVAEGMRCLARNNAFLARLGGDEFVAVFAGKDAAGHASQFSGDIIAFLRQPFDIDGRHAAVGASVGISTGGPGTPPAEIMRQADVAMYEAKRTGKNRVVSYQTDIDSSRSASATIASDLRRFIAEGAMGIAYQPIVSAESGNIVAVEALSRWPSGLEPAVEPGRFIAVAETNGLIDELGEAVLHRACTDALGWSALRLSVNVSPVQLRDPDFVPRVLRVLGKTGFSPQRLELEVTESVVLDDFERIHRQFAALRAVGIAVALDDFGTGFSSIGYLRKLQFDRIKIDRSITSKVLDSSTEQHIVQGTVLMASALSASVTAEGVDQPALIQILRLAGCRELQGFLFHRPMVAQMIDTLLGEPQAAALTG